MDKGQITEGNLQRGEYNGREEDEFIVPDEQYESEERYSNVDSDTNRENELIFIS